MSSQPGNHSPLLTAFSHPHACLLGTSVKPLQIFNHIYHSIEKSMVDYMGIHIVFHVLH